MLIAIADRDLGSDPREGCHIFGNHLRVYGYVIDLTTHQIAHDDLVVNSEGAR